MAGHESIENDAFVSAVYHAAESKEGFTLHIEPNDQLRFALSGRGEFTLWVQHEAPTGTSPSTEGEVSSALPEQVIKTEQEQQKVKLSGLIAQEPRYTKPGGVDRVGFILAEHPDDGETVFHRVYARNRHAHTIQKQNPRLGEQVLVNGFLQHRTVVQNGKSGEVEEVYCYRLQVQKSAAQHTAQ